MTWKFHLSSILILIHKNPNHILSRNVYPTIKSYPNRKEPGTMRSSDLIPSSKRHEVRKPRSEYWLFHLIVIKFYTVFNPLRFCFDRAENGAKLQSDSICKAFDLVYRTHMCAHPPILTIASESIILLYTKCTQIFYKSGSMQQPTPLIPSGGRGRWTTKKMH